VVEWIIIDMKNLLCPVYFLSTDENPREICKGRQSVAGAENEKPHAGVD